MPIVIKEISPSDSIPSVVEKINFNFDQLILAGGGPPGIQGIQGPVGIAGPQGDPGNIWLTGSTTTGNTGQVIGDRILLNDGRVFGWTAGSTWSYSGVNLLGPTGPTGAEGGSLEWKIFSGSTSSTGGTNTWIPNSVGVTTNNIDFLIPNRADKNSVFLGDRDFANNFLYNFSKAGSSPSSNVPKLTIIQNGVNNTISYPINGLAIGAMGITGSTSIGSSGIYGNTGSITDAYNFFYSGFYSEFLGGTSFNTKFGMRTFRMPIKLIAGGPSGPTYSRTELELIGDNVVISGYDDSTTPGTKKIEIRRDSSASANIYFRSYLGATAQTLKEITIQSPPGSSSIGVVSLQNISGNSLPGVTHGFGTVIIGPTTSSSGPLGIVNPQALGIVRGNYPTSSNTYSSTNPFYLKNSLGQTSIDSAIAFFQDTHKVVGSTHPWSNLSGRIIPARIIADAEISNTPTVDFMIHTAGLENNKGFSPSPDSNAGRFGFQNGIIPTKPQMPFHVSLEQDSGYRSSAWDRGNTGPGVDLWIAGFDSYNGETKSGGLGIGYKQWAENPEDPESSFYSNPIFQTYYRTDRGQTSGFNPYTNEGGTAQIQGINNPHLYIQTGIQETSGNLGIGIFPGSSSGITTVDAAWAKLSISGTMTIGSTSAGYHRFQTRRPTNGILLEGTLIQGATGLDQISTQIYGSTSINTALESKISISANSPIFGRSFISRGHATGSTFSWLADFALGDMKTGLQSIPGQTGIGYIVANPGTTYPTNGAVGTTAPTRIAKFSARGETGFTANNDYGGFTVLHAFAKGSTTLGVNNLVQQNITYEISEGSGNYLVASIWEIPVKRSTIFLNLTGNKSSMWAEESLTSGPPEWITLTNSRLVGTGSTSTYSIGFSLEDGHFDGQELELIILGVDSGNSGVLLTGHPVYNGRGVTSVTGVTSVDNIIMSPEPLFAIGGSSNNIPFGTLPSTKLGLTGTNNDAWPYPFSIGPTAGFGSGISNAGWTDFLSNTVTYTVNSFKDWTNRYTSGASGPFDGSGYGAFYLFPYRSIKFVWRIIETSPNSPGKWYELSRQNLVAPQTRTWNSNYQFSIV